MYRQDGLTLDQLAAFAITDDHARQEQVFENLSYNKEPWIIRRDMTEGKVPASDRRVIFVGAEAYEEAGGAIVRDLFTEDGGGYFEDAGLLDTLAVEKLRDIAAEVQAEGWKWALWQIDYPHDHGMRRYHPQSVALSDEDETRLAAAAAEYDELTEGYSSHDELPEDVAAKLEALDAEIDAITARRSAYEPDMVARGGAFVVLSPNGLPRIERGFVRAEDEPQPEADPEDETAADRIVEDDERGADAEDAEIEDADDGKPIADSLIRDLTAHRTLALRLALGEQPDKAMIALTHGLVAQRFYNAHAASCLEIRVNSEALGGHAEGIADTVAAEGLAERHDHWAEQLPRDVAGLWAFIVELDGDSRLALLAHCVSLSVNAVQVPWERKAGPLAAADVLATAVDLDMTAHWTPSARSYFGRVTKAHIAAAVREAVSPEAAERISPMKKADMAEAAEQLVVGTGWLPSILRARDAEPEAGEADVGETTDGEMVEQPSEAEDSETSYAVAAE